MRNIQRNIFLILIAISIVFTLIVLILKGEQNFNKKLENKTKILAPPTIMGQVNSGLTLVKVNDTVTVLIYRGVESSSMIQIK